jgi:hypothetical protein
MLPLSPDTLSRVEALFAPDQRDTARAALENDCANNLPFCEKMDLFALERIRFAVLKLSAGSLDGLRREIDQAKLDWRDTLVAAGFGHDVNAHSRWFPDRPD